jgi:hypothetical protein
MAAGAFVHSSSNSSSRSVAVAAAAEGVASAVAEQAAPSAGADARYFYSGASLTRLLTTPHNDTESFCAILLSVLPAAAAAECVQPLFWPQLRTAMLLC